MKAYQNNEQNNEQILSLDAKVPYEAPQLTVMGKVEHLTALAGNGTPDLLHLAHGNIL